MDKIEKIRQEIKRLKEENHNIRCQHNEKYCIGYDDAFNDILLFIESLQQEQPKSICPRCVYKNKTDDICEYPYGGKSSLINENGVYECNGFEGIEQREQPEQPKMGYDEAYLNEKIAKATKSWKGVDVDKFMDEMRGREPEVDFEKAAEKYAFENFCSPDYNPTEDWIGYCEKVFKAGAKWMAEHLKK